METINNSYVFFLGNHPAISAAECWRVLKSQNSTPQLELVSDTFLIVTTSQPIPKEFIDALGGTDRIGKVLAQQKTPWQAPEVLTHLSPTLPKNKKVAIGVSTINYPLSFNKALGLELKKSAKTQDIKLRFITPKSSSRLNAAQVIFNQLTDQPNLELTLINHQNTHYLIKTEQIQNITAYQVRDTDRPARDARIGLLPPKLAQIMINLSLPENNITSFHDLHIFDPFCGMGTILQEAWLLGIKSSGADSNPKMILASSQNLEHLYRKFSPSAKLKPSVFQHDTTIPYPKKLNRSISNVVTEPFLGTPLSKPLAEAALPSHFKKLAQLYYSSFKNLLPVLKPNASLLFILPAFRSPARNSAFIPFPNTLIDSFSKLGYSKAQLIPDQLGQHFKVNDRVTSIYSRPDALVGRELTLWTKKSNLNS